MPHDPGDGHEEARAALEQTICRIVGEELGRFGMTTDPEEGQRQVDQMTATKQHEFKVGDKVRLRAGGPEMTVAAVEDYGNQIVCEYQVRRVDTDPPGEWETHRETHSRASLAPVDQ